MAPEGQVYWEDRNVFGGAERLRLQASVFYAPPWYIASQSLNHFSSNDIGGRVSASFLKPALWGTTNDLLVDALAEKMSTSGAGFVGYQAEDADVTASLRHRFNQNFWVQAGLEAQSGDATDALGTVNYTLVGVPVSANFDTTDSKLDQTRGVRLNVSAVGFGTFLGSSLDMVQAKAGASAYYSIDADLRYVLAGRVAAGAMGGPQLDAIPANWRFYAGGGGSVRGYAYNELGPTVWWGAVVGGKSVFDASAELRVKVTDTIGVVPFFDIGNAFSSNLPNFSEPLFAAAGPRAPGTPHLRRTDPPRRRLSLRASRRHGELPSTSASGSPSDVREASLSPPSHARAARSPRPLLRERLRGGGGQGRARRPDLAGFVLVLDESLDRRGGRGAVLRRVHQRHRPLRSAGALAQGRQGSSRLDPLALFNRRLEVDQLTIGQHAVSAASASL